MDLLQLLLQLSVGKEKKNNQKKKKDFIIKPQKNKSVQIFTLFL